MNSSSSNTQILKKAISEIQNGELKDDVFDRYREKVEPNTLASKIAFYPDKDLAESGKSLYSSFYIILITYICLFIIVFARNLLNDSPNTTKIVSMLIPVAIYVSILFFSLKKHFMSFRFSFIFCFRDLITVSEKYKSIGGLSILGKVLLVSILIFGISIIILSIIINKKLYPHMKFLRAKYHVEGGPMYKYYPNENGI